MNIFILNRVTQGLPEASKVAILKDGKIVPAKVVAITRTQDLPELSTLPQTRDYHTIKEWVIIADEESLKQFTEETKVVYRDIEGNWGV